MQRSSNQGRAARADAADGAFWRNRPSLAEPAAASGRGRGLFAVRAIGAGDLIERACTVEIAPDQAARLDGMQPLGDFYFQHPEDKDAGLMVLGLMSLCNHNDDPNADIQFDLESDIGWVASLVAKRSIGAGEEITYKYKCPLWFDEHR